MLSIISALVHLSADEGEGGAGLVVSAGDALQLQLKVQLQRLCSHQVGQRRAPLERGRQEVVGLCALILQQAVVAYALSNEVTPLLLLQGAQQRGLRRERNTSRDKYPVYLWLLLLHLRQKQ